MQCVRSPDGLNKEKNIVVGYAKVEKEKEIKSMEKMRFEEFKDAVVKGIKEWLPESFAGAHVSLQVVTKNNDVKLTGLTITSEESNITPTIYLEQFFEKYQDGTDMSEILRKIAEIRVQNEIEGNFDAEQIIDFDRCKKRIFPRLIGFEMNRDLLEQRPHVLIEDLAVVFHIDLGNYDDGSMTVPINNQLSVMWGMDADALYDLAVKNLTDANVGTFNSMTEVMAEMMLPQMIDECDGDHEAAEQILSEMMPPEEKMYVLSKKDRINGAAILLDKNMMKKVIEKVGTDFYILPSSVHECLIVPAEVWMELEDFEAMVQEVNATQVAVHDRLSDHVYRYTAESGIIRA